MSTALRAGPSSSITFKLLSRLTFSNNTGEENDATRIGAFYNDNDPNWKSRGITGVSNDTATDGPPDDNGVSYLRIPLNALGR